MAEMSRWSCAPNLGGTCTISYDLGDVHDLYQLRMGKIPFTLGATNEHIKFMRVLRCVFIEAKPQSSWRKRYRNDAMNLRAVRMDAGLHSNLFNVVAYTIHDAFNNRVLLL